MRPVQGQQNLPWMGIEQPAPTPKMTPKHGGPWIWDRPTHYNMWNSPTVVIVLVLCIQLIKLCCALFCSNARFSSAKSNGLTDQHDIFCFSHAFVYKQQHRETWWWITNSRHKLISGSPTGNLRSRVLASHALNISCSFGQSVRSIENRCMVMF